MWARPMVSRIPDVVVCGVDTSMSPSKYIRPASGWRSSEAGQHAERDRAVPAQDERDAGAVTAAADLGDPARQVPRDLGDQAQVLLPGVVRVGAERDAGQVAVVAHGHAPGREPGEQARVPQPGGRVFLAGAVGPGRRRDPDQLDAAHGHRAYGIAQRGVRTCQPA